jgi:hypothetical protein
MKIIFLLLVTLNFLFATDTLQMQTAKIFDINDKTAKIQIPNLKIGQSGVIIKNIDKNSIIVSQATIIKSTNSNSTIKLINKPIIKQDSIPRSVLIPKNGDKFILNHLYKTSLLIVPNVKAKTAVEKLYPKQNFLNEDFFAAHLKLINSPIPSKKTLIKFSQSQQIGTIFIVVQNNLFIVDGLTFKIIDTVLINNDDKSTSVPFLTKIENIEQRFWQFGDDKIKNYDNYYLNLLEII